MNSSSGFVDSAMENGFFICKFDRCGRKFDSETRLRDHQARMHDKDIAQLRQQIQGEMNLSNGSNMYKKEDSLKLPTINNGSQVLSNSQRIPIQQKTQDKQDQLHPVIRQAQQIANSANGTTIIANNSGNYTHQKKASLSSSIVKNNNSQVGSRPTSSSSSNFNTTSSSTNNVEFGMKENNIMKNSYLNNSQVQQNQIQYEQNANVDPNQFNHKQQLMLEKQQQYTNRLTPNLMRRNNSQTQVQNTKPSPTFNKEQQQHSESSIPNVQEKLKVKEERVKTKEEILFGSKPLDRKKVVVQKNEKVTDKQAIIKNNKDDEDEEDDIDKEINREDQILNMEFSDEDDQGEDQNEEDLGIMNDDDEEGEEEEDQEEEEDIQIKKGQEQIKQRPSPTKDLKSKGSLLTEKNDKSQKSEVERRRVSFANKEVDLVKDKETEEQRKLSEIETKKILTSKFILDYTGYEKLDEVEQLILRKKNLSYLKDTEELDWSELMNMQFLCVAHNPFMEQIDCISSIPNHNLLELNLEYNNITDISPIFHHTQLQKLYLNGNKILSIKGISILASLKTLTLMKNCIKGFDVTLDTLCQLNKLEELELEQNPVSSRFNYKYDILWKLKLKKLDGEEITDLDLELSRTFQKEYLNYTKESQRSGLPVRPGTAKDWGSRSTLNDSNNNNKSYKDRFKQKINDLVQESKEVLNCIPEDRASELETEIELARQQEEQLEAELEMLYCEQSELREKKEKLMKQNEEFSISVSEYQQLQSQKGLLTAKYRTYLDQLKTESDAAQFIKEIFRLNLKLEDLQKENQELVIENNVLQQTQSKFFTQSQIRPQSANKNLRQSKTDFQKSLTMFTQIEQNIKQQQQQQQQLQQSQASKYTSKIYDDAEEVLSQGEEDEQQQDIILDRQSNSNNVKEKENKLKQQSLVSDQKDKKGGCNDQMVDKNKINKQSKDNNTINDEDEVEDDEEYNPDDLDLDIGFDSDDLDEDMKEIRDMLKKNENALKDVKNDLTDI